MIFAYFGPDGFLPMTSVIATALGFVMMFGRRSFRFLGSLLFADRSGTSRKTAASAPHFRLKRQSRKPTTPVS